MCGIAFVLALLCSSGSSAASRTTQPSQKVSVYFVFTDQKLAYEILRASAGGSGDVYLEKYVLRGDFATFIVINRTKKRQGFAFMGKTFALGPGQKVHFSKALLARGRFPYRSTTEPGSAFRGVFPVD